MNATDSSDTPGVQLTVENWREGDEMCERERERERERQIDTDRGAEWRGRGKSEIGRGSREEKN